MAVDYQSFFSRASQEASELSLVPNTSSEIVVGDHSNANLCATESILKSHTHLVEVDRVELLRHLEQLAQRRFLPNQPPQRAHTQDIAPGERLPPPPFHTGCGTRETKSSTGGE
jgi:hypothetical protein